jgi:hypothetical protein
MAGAEMDLDYEDEYDEPAFRRRRSRMKSSGLGIASFVVSLLAGFIIFSIVIYGIVMEIRTPGWIDEDTPDEMFLALLVLGSLLVSCVGLVLGITGFVQVGRSKVFPMLGVGFNAMIILGIIGLIVLGVLAK